jgi:hypothetical protein
VDPLEAVAAVIVLMPARIHVVKNAKLLAEAVVVDLVVCNYNIKAILNK